MISKNLPCALLAACLISGQQENCLWSMRMSYLERVWDSSESHLTSGLLHRQWTGKIVNADWIFWDRCGWSAGSKACLHHAGMFRSLLCAALPFLVWSLLTRKSSLLSLKLIMVQTEGKLQLPRLWRSIICYIQYITRRVLQTVRLQQSLGPQVSPYSKEQTLKKAYE